MTAKLIKGTEIRDLILKEIREEVNKIKEKHGKVPGLVTILVGQNPASISYVTAKIEAAKSLGFRRSRTTSRRPLRSSSSLPSSTSTTRTTASTAFWCSSLFRNTSMRRRS